ncbi:M81 family metallopeptidase [Zobellella aerophila]
MKIAIAGFHIESVSFLAHTSGYQDFEAGALRGEALLKGLSGTNTVIGGMLDICRERAITPVPLVYAYLGALGRVADEVIERYTTEICEGLKQVPDLDGVLLHLHGAAWAPGYEDPERHMIEAVRQAVGDGVRLMVAFDYHGNLDEHSIARADAAFAYHRSPHTDMGDTGRRCADCMVRTLNGQLKPHCVLLKPGLLTPSIFSATQLRPLADVIADARRREQDAADYLDISVMAGFSYADAVNTGFSVIAVSGECRQRAESEAREIRDRLWQERERIYRPEPVYGVKEAVAEVMARAPHVSKPFVLLEHADRLNDSTYVLAELVAQDAQNAAVPFLWDPEAARRAAAAGVGNRVRLKLGAHSSDKAGPRLELECEVLQAEPKTYHISGAMLQGTRVDLGLTALLRVGGILISVVSRPAFGVDEDAFTVFGQDPRDYDIIVLRSKTHFRQVYEALAEQILIVDTPDYGPADLLGLPYRRLDTRKVYPFTTAMPSAQQEEPS